MCEKKVKCRLGKEWNDVAYVVQFEFGLDSVTASIVTGELIEDGAGPSSLIGIGHVPRSGGISALFQFIVVGKIVGVTFADVLVRGQEKDDFVLLVLNGHDVEKALKLHSCGERFTR